MLCYVKSLQSCPILCDPIDGSPPGSPIPGILQARTLEWAAISFSNAWKWKVKSESEVAQSCPTLSDPMDCSLTGFSVHGIFQARVLEWGAIAFSNTTVQKHQFFSAQPSLWSNSPIVRESEVAQSCPSLCNPMDCSLTGFSIHGIFQARVLEWGAIAFSVLAS